MPYQLSHSVTPLCVCMICMCVCSSLWSVRTATHILRHFHSAVNSSHTSAYSSDFNIPVKVAWSVNIHMYTKLLPACTSPQTKTCHKNTFNTQSTSMVNCSVSAQAFIEIGHNYDKEHCHHSIPPPKTCNYTKILTPSKKQKNPMQSGPDRLGSVSLLTHQNTQEVKKNAI